MREDLLIELENEYAQLRADNERTEEMRKEKIRIEQPRIYELTKERENIVFGTLRNIVNGIAPKADDLPERMEKLNEQIRTMLTENGYPADYLAPVYRCPICKDTGRTGDIVKESCECLKKAYQNKLRKKIGLQSGKKESFSTFDLNVFSDEKKDANDISQRDLMKIIKEDCKQWVELYPNNENRDILISGKSGLGKTFLLRAMAERLIERDVNVLIISAYKMLEILRKNYFENDDSSTELLDVEVLMIDDLGSEPMMQNITIEQLFNLINERQNRNLSTIISTNLTIDEIKGRYTERIASRISDRRRCLVLTLLGKDIRTGGNLKA